MVFFSSQKRSAARHSYVSLDQHPNSCTDGQTWSQAGPFRCENHRKLLFEHLQSPIVKAGKAAFPTSKKNKYRKGRKATTILIFFNYYYFSFSLVMEPSKCSGSSLCSIVLISHRTPPAWLMVTAAKQRDTTREQIKQSMKLISCPVTCCPSRQRENDEILIRSRLWGWFASLFCSCPDAKCCFGARFLFSFPTP